MGYNPKATFCDLAELKGLATISAIFESSSLEGRKAERDSPVDLKLGSLSDFGKGLANSCRDHTASFMDPFSSPAGSSKRARGPSGAGQIISCLVDGCNADLSKCRDYHRRHKVCEMHSKTPRVTVGGHEQRFCQQCSRFHSLGEFDEGKRSCRKRLEGHNRRRRKPQPEPLLVNPGSFLSVSQGSRFLPYSSQPMISATSVVSTPWSGVVKSESNPALYNGSVSSSYSQAYRGRQFPFLQVPDSPLTVAASTSQTLHHDGSSNHGHKMFCNGLNQVIDSDRALSLLSSSSSSSTETPEMGLGRIIHPSATNVARPMLPSLNYINLNPYPGSQPQGLEGQPGGSGLLSNMRNSNNLCQDVFQSGSDGPSGSGGHQTLSFSWE